MRLIATVLAGVIVGGILAGCPNGSQTGGTAHPDVLRQVGLQYYWRMAQPLGEGETVRRIYLMDENVYLISNRNRIYAIDASLGIPKWSAEVAIPGQTVFRPYHADNMSLTEKPSSVGEMIGYVSAKRPKVFNAAVINTSDQVLVFDRTSGRLYRQIRFDDFVANRGGAADTMSFFVGATNGKFYGYSLNEAARAWSLSAGDKLVTAPVEQYRGRVFVAGGDFGLYSARTGIVGEGVWRQQLDGPVRAAFHVDARGCYVPCDDNRLYAFDALTGMRQWVFHCEGPCRAPVQVGERTVFQYAEGDGLYAVNIVNGHKRWRMPEGRRVLAVMKGEAYVLDDAGQLRVTDEILGKMRHTVSLTGLTLFADNCTVAAVYAATADGHVYCLRGPDAGRLTADMLKGK